MTTQSSPLGLKSPPSPAWARTVVERRLLWLAKCHPKMDPRKRHAWGIKEFQTGQDGTKP